MDSKKKISQFAWVMAILSVIAVLLGVAVFYWLMETKPARTLALSVNTPMVVCKHKAMV